MIALGAVLGLALGIIVSVTTDLPRQGGGHWFEPSIAHWLRNPRSYAGFVVREGAKQPAPATRS
jgi:hypothetical protein